MSHLMVRINRGIADARLAGIPPDSLSVVMSMPTLDNLAVEVGAKITDSTGNRVFGLPILIDPGLVRGRIVLRWEVDCA